MAAPLPVAVAVTGLSRQAEAAAAWDARVERALAKGPPSLRRGITWLREPRRRWLRIPAGVLLVLGGLLAILPVLGLWMLPLGLALLGEDVPALKAWLEGVASWVESRLPGRRS